MDTMASPGGSASWRSDRSLLIRYFLGAYGFTWVLQLAIPLFGLSFESAPAQVLYILSVLGPLLSAMAVIVNSGGKAGLRALFAKALQWRFSLIWYLMAIGTVAALKLISTGLYMVLGGVGPEQWVTASSAGLLFVLLSQFGYVMFAEEIGWRAFALPRLLEQFGALGGTLLLAFLHACWHLPMFFVPGSNQAGSSFVLYLFIHVAWSTSMTFLYDRSGQSALPCLLFHASLNVAAFVVGAPAGSEIYQRLLYGVLILSLVPFFPRPLFRSPWSASMDLKRST